MAASTFTWIDGDVPEDFVEVKRKPKQPSNEQKRKQYRLSVFDTTRHTETFFAGRVRHNVMTDQIEIRSRNGNTWTPHDLAALNGLYIELAKAIEESTDRTVCTDVIRRMARENPFNPLTDYFTGLKAHPAPDTAKFNGLATWMYGADIDSPHADEILKMMLVAAVARTFEPGQYYRYVPFLMGEREIGKSLLAALAPLGLGNTTEPQANKYAIDQVLVAARQSLVLELSEVDAFCKTVPSSIIKTFVSATTSVTPIKNKNAEPFVRTWVVFGTSNKANFLPSDLRRRFLPIDLFHLRQGEFRLGEDGYKQIEAARDGIWAAAVQEYFANWVGKPITYREELLADLDAFTDDYVSESRWYVDCVELLNFDRRMFLSREDVRRAISQNAGQDFLLTDDQISGFMSKNGWSMRRVVLTPGGKQQRLFVHPRYKQHGSVMAAFVAEAEFRPNRHKVYGLQGDHDF